MSTGADPEGRRSDAASRSVILGLDIRGGAMRAVAAGQDGTVAARMPQGGSAAVTDPSSISAFARAHAVSAIGAAAHNPHEPLPPELVAQLAADLAHVKPARVIARGTAIALAEQWCGAAAGARHVAAITLDESVHAGLAVEGRPFEGAHGYAGAIGWMSLNPVQREDYRRSGGLEAEIGTAGIVKRLVWRVKAGDNSRVVDAVNGDLAAVTVAHVFEHARAGDAVSESVVRDTARYIGMAIANILTVADPDVVILGGLIAEAADLLLEQSRIEAARRLPAAMAAGLTVRASALGADAALLGAVRAAQLSS